MSFEGKWHEKKPQIMGNIWIKCPNSKVAEIQKSVWKSFNLNLSKTKFCINLGFKQCFYSLSGFLKQRRSGSDSTPKQCEYNGMCKFKADSHLEEALICQFSLQTFSPLFGSHWTPVAPVTQCNKHGIALPLLRTAAWSAPGNSSFSFPGGWKHRKGNNVIQDRSWDWIQKAQRRKTSPWKGKHPNMERHRNSNVFHNQRKKESRQMQGPYLANRNVHTFVFVRKTAAHSFSTIIV